MNAQTLPPCTDGPTAGQDLLLTTPFGGGALQLSPTCQLTPTIGQIFEICAAVYNDTTAPYGGTRLYYPTSCSVRSMTRRPLLPDSIVF